MHEKIIEIPNYKIVHIKDIVLDYNGTIAKDGFLKDEVKVLLPILAKEYSLHVVTADTFGSVKKELQPYDIDIKILQSQNHTLEKQKYVDELNSSSCVAIGNGNNDALMLKYAEISVAIMGDEGCSTKCLINSDIVCKSISEALELFLDTKRLIATLRI